MNIVNLYGGLGNQIFQYVFGRFVLGHNVKYSTDFFDSYALHSYDIEKCFDLDIVKASSLEIKDLIGFQRPVLRKIYGRVPHHFRSKRFVMSEESPIIHASLNDCYFQGYWQHPIFIREYALKRSEIINHLKFSALSVEQSDYHYWKKQVEKPNTLVIHVRKGDYTLAKNKQIFSDYGVDYYSNAVTTILSSISIDKIFVSSNDKTWCDVNLIPLLQTFSVDIVPIYDTSESPILDFMIMAASSNLFISNSTYSWWSAFLNCSSNIYTPKCWFVDGRPSINLPSWHKL